MRHPTLGFLAAGLLALALLLSSASLALARGAIGTAESGGTQRGAAPDQSSVGMMGDDPGMMGSGGMMGGSDDAVVTSSPQAAQALAQRLAANAHIDRRTNTVTYRTATVELVVLASPEGQRDMTWSVDGLVNPTIRIPAGARITVRFFDADVGTPHGWELTATPPPYRAMVMMDAPVAFPGAFAMPVSGATEQRWFGRTLRFTAARVGVYFYLCPVPGHAQQGMFGKLVVR